ncbi:MAG TPA: PEP-CTERM sorting domain-containing protein [Burkholderiales bacterium]|nr:PEP-CTERM sorting domain-containing protein [Burkholderiales bacterium]
MARVEVRAALAFALLSFMGLPASAAGLDAGNLSNYGIVSIGAGSSIKINSGPITGNILVGDGSTVVTSGGNNGQIVGSIYDDGSVPQSAFSHLQTPATSGQFYSVTKAYEDAAITSAKQLSDYAASLTANQTFTTTVSTAHTFTANSGVYVIDFTNIQNAALTFKGNANTTFIVNVSGYFNTNQKMYLDGISSSQLLFNFTASSGKNVFQTSGGDQLYGSYLATNGSEFQFSNLVLNGALWNTDGHIEFVSGSHMTSNPFRYVPAVPEPETYAMLIAGLGLMGFVARRRKKRT